MLLCGVFIKAQQQWAGSQTAGMARVSAQPHLVSLTDLLHVTQNAALQKLCRSLRGAASSATAHREDPLASAPEKASSVSTAKGAAAGGSNGALPQGASAAPPAPAAAGGCAAKQGEAVGGGAAFETGPTEATHLPVEGAAALHGQPLAVGENTACDAGGVEGSAPGGAAEALAGSSDIGGGAELLNIACAVGSAAGGPNSAAMGANASSAGPELGKV